MLWFNHPKPFIQRPVAMQMAERKTEPPPDPHTITVDMRDEVASDLRQGTAGTCEPAPAIRFSVSYKLREYLSIVHDHAAYLSKQAKRSKPRRSILLWPLVAILATPIFLLKQRRMPVCDFTIDAERITRVSAAGTLTKSWLDVAAVRAYSKGWLVSFKTGAMPIPYRCLDAEQSKQLHAIIAPRRSVSKAPERA